MNLERLKVLVVDDEDFSRNHVIKLLEKLSITQVVQCDDGLEALGLLMELDADFGLVVSDLYMPGMNGLNLLEHVRLGKAGSVSPLLPFIILTGDTDEGLAKRVCSRGVDGYLVKPVDLHSFREKLLQVVSYIQTA